MDVRVRRLQRSHDVVDEARLKREHCRRFGCKKFEVRSVQRWYDYPNATINVHVDLLPDGQAEGSICPREMLDNRSAIFRLIYGIAYEASKCANCGAPMDVADELYEEMIAKVLP